MPLTASPAVLLTALVGGLLFLPASQAQAPALSKCQTSAFVIDPDPKGLNVRSGPSSKHKVLAVLPTLSNPVMVEISAAQNGWLKIHNATEPGFSAPVFKGPGWVYAPLLGTGTRPYERPLNVPLYQLPQTTSRIITRLREQTTLPLLSCQGTWVKVKSAKGTGWLAPENQCPNSVTTCP